MSRKLYYAACAFGLEGIVARELERLNIEKQKTTDARVYFYADENEIARANICLRCADRIYMVLGEFKAVTFEELFENVAKINFGDIIPQNAKIPVTGDAVKSALGSVSDVQAITKKAIIKSMKRKYGNVSFEESKKPFNIYVTIIRDNVTVGLNTSGSGLNRRGYRVKNAQAPLKETLAAALIEISRWYSHPFYDPMCGSGTIAVEAAMMAKNIMPGALRHFDAMHFGSEFKREFDREKQKAADGIKKAQMPIFASDIDKEAVELALFHAENAGVLDAVEISRADVSDFKMKTDTASIVTNPPYAIRLGEEKEVSRLYTKMGKALLACENAKIFVITADEDFERKFGKKADKKRKLYNGNIKCTYYQFFKKNK